MPHSHRTPMTRHQRRLLSAFIQRKRRARREQERAARRALGDFKRDTSLDLEEDEEDYAPVGFHFSPQRHGLTPAQCRLAQQLLRKANQERPIRGGGQQGQFRRALRIAGIISAVRNGRVGNTRWGRSMLGKRGGRVMALHGPHILAENRRRLQAQRQAGDQRPETWAPAPRQLVPWTVEQLLEESQRQERQPKDFMAY